MTGEYFIIPMLLVIGVSYLIVRGAAIMLIMTGLDEKRARFQALSAFSGTGFTTREAELIVNHPQRRKIVTWLMILGNAGLVTVIVTATSSLVSSEGYHIGITSIIIILGIFLVYRLVSRNAVIRRWENFIEHKFLKWESLTGIPIEDVIHFIEGYGIIRVIALEGSDIMGKSVADLIPANSEISIIGIERDNHWISFPQAKEVIGEDDTLMIYGPLELLKGHFKPASTGKRLHIKPIKMKRSKKKDEE